GAFARIVDALIDVTIRCEKREERTKESREERERTLAKIPAKVASKAKQISVLLMDVDGTLTDGSVTLASTPDNHALEVKTFDAHDGQGLTLAVTAGLRTGVITGRSSAALRRRCKELDIEFVYEKQGHKINVQLFAPTTKMFYAK